VPTLNHFFGQVVQAVEQIARARGAAMYLTCLGDDPDAEQAALETLLSRHMVGLIVAPIAADQSYLKPWRNHTAMVFIDRRPRKLAAASVVHDDIGGAAAAITHLVEHGHRRIAFAGDSLTVPTTARRRHGYETTLFDAGIAVDPFLVSFGADASPVIPRLLALPDPPTVGGARRIQLLHDPGRQRGRRSRSRVPRPARTTRSGRPGRSWSTPAR
jgi:LacI family transcriptional regulator